jgi:hypothetical protein
MKAEVEVDKSLLTQCKILTVSVFQGPEKPLSFLIRTYPVAGVNRQSNGHMGILQGNGTLFLLSMNTDFVFIYICDLIVQIKWKCHMAIKVLYFIFFTQALSKFMLLLLIQQYARPHLKTHKI